MRRFAAVASATIFWLTVAQADPAAVVYSGLPIQIKPTYQEPGVPAFSFPTGGSFGGSTNPSSGDDSSGYGGSSSGGSRGIDSGGSALDTMNAQTWGAQANTAAYAMGINPSALAGTCMMESRCQNSAASGSGSASGVWQMINSTYNSDIAGAVALDPSIASSIVPGFAGSMDPATEAYAAAYELRQDALILQNNGFTNPTVLQTRALYQFGQGAGPDIAAAPDSDNLASYLSLTPAQLAANGISSTTTVGQWRQTIASKLGGTANQVVLAGR
jgi:hypothetical protein